MAVVTAVLLTSASASHRSWQTTVATCSNPAPAYLGLDAFRHLGDLSHLDLLSRTESMTTADPAATNADWTNPVRVAPDGSRVLFQQVGPGVATFLRMQEQIGGPWSLSVDGGGPVVVSPSDLGGTTPADGVSSALPYPLSLSPAESHGSSLVMASLPFNRSLTWASAGQNGNFYGLWRKLPAGTPVTSWTLGPTSADVANLLRLGAAWAMPADALTTGGTFSLPALAQLDIATLSGQGPRQIRRIHFRVPFNEKVRFGNSRLRIYWDGEPAPSVDAPVKFLAGDGAGVYQPAGRPLVGGFLAYAGGDGSTYMDYDLYWPMPYHGTARISIDSTTPSVLPSISWSLSTEPLTAPARSWAPFHATTTSVPDPQPGSDMTFLDVPGSGRIVGTVINFGAVGSTLEGNPHVYLDDAQVPQVQATGTEEWGLGGDYWDGGMQVSLPLGGLPSSTNNPPGTDVEGAAEYRFLVADSLTFNRHVVIKWEHGPVDDGVLPYQAVTLWYGVPTVTAVPSDALTLGSSQQAAAHGLVVAGASTYSLTAGYPYVVSSPVLTSRVVTTVRSSSFSLALTPGASGAVLRRTYDSAVPDQRADVFVDGVPAGTWYSPGSIARTDPTGLSRRVMQDEFPLPPSLVAGKSSLRIEIRNDATATPPSRAWTAVRYQLFSIVPPGCNVVTGAYTREG